jgi:hypothetical protein
LYILPFPFSYPFVHFPNLQCVYQLSFSRLHHFLVTHVLFESFFFLFMHYYRVTSFPYYSCVIRIIVFPIYALLLCASRKLCCVLHFPPYTFQTPLFRGQYFTPISCLCASCECRWCLRIFNWDTPWKLTTLCKFLFHICLFIFWVLVLLYVFFFWFFVWFWFLLVIYMCFCLYLCCVSFL